LRHLRQTDAVPGDAERRAAKVAREVRWIGRHPTIAKVVFWWLVVMVFGEAAMALSYVVGAAWGAAAFYGAAAVLVAWLAHRWAGEVREAALIHDEADRA
jgi:hypothetical protein